MTTAWTKRIKSWLVPSPSAPHLAPNVPPGIYHYQCERDSEYIRFHLRIEPNGEALLIAGASEVARLSRVGAEAAKRLLDAEDRNALVASIKHPNVQNLYREVTSLLDELGRPNSRFPIFNLSDPIDSTRDAKLIAPFQADVEIGEPEKLHAVLRRLWDAGIPHVRLLHAPTVRTSELVRAAEHAEDIGMIAGVRALANWLHPDRQINQLAEVGLDYVVCPWGMTQDLHRELFGAEDYEALPAVLEQIRQWEMTPVVELPLVAETIDAMIASMQQLTDWQVSHIECFALVAPETWPAIRSSTTPFAPAELKQIAAFIEELPDEHPLQTIWLPPLVCRDYDSLRERVLQGPRAGGDVTVHVDVNGEVFPPRGPRISVGNLLHESWDRIWQEVAFRRFREHVEANTRCSDCPGLAICAADCPSDPRGWTVDD